MKAVATVVLASLALAGTCHGGEVVRELPWTRPPAGATLVAPGAGRTGASIRIERRAGGSLQVLRLENPPIATPVWAVVGEVRYEGVAGDGYLEMWSVFKDGRFFSRTLDQAGPMSRLSGASGWREFVLPFFSRADLPPPVALEVIRPATRDDRTGEQGPGLRRRVTGPVRPEGRRRRSTARSRPPAVAPLDLTPPAPGPRIAATVPSSRWTSGR